MATPLKLLMEILASYRRKKYSRNSLNTQRIENVHCYLDVKLGDGGHAAGGAVG